jgi:hypothetical protein
LYDSSNTLSPCAGLSSSTIVCGCVPPWVDGVWCVGVDHGRVDRAEHGALGNSSKNPAGGILAVVGTVKGICHTQAIWRPQLLTLTPLVARSLAIVRAGHVAIGTQAPVTI